MYNVAKQVKPEIHFTMEEKNRSVALTEEGNNELERIMSSYVDLPNLKIELKGYADGVGSALDNEKLSIKRISSIQMFLVELGFTTDQIQTNSIGEKEAVKELGDEVPSPQFRKVAITICSSF